MNRKITSLFVIFLVFLVPLVSGITGSIGNAKAIVNVDLKKSNILERTVLVKNVNNVSVNIKLEASDDLEGITEILDKEFVLKENEEKNARFTVTIPKEGIYNGNINIFFKPIEGKGAGVALQSNLIIKAANGDTVLTNVQTNTTKTNSDILSKDNSITGDAVSSSENGIEFSPGLIIFLILIAIIVISLFIVLMRRI